MQTNPIRLYVVHKNNVQSYTMRMQAHATETCWEQKYEKKLRRFRKMLLLVQTKPVTCFIYARYIYTDRDRCFAVVFPPRTLPPDPVILLRFLCLCLTIVTRFLFPASARNTRHCRYPATNADSEHLGRWILLSQSMSRTFLKPWFHVKIKLFWTLLVLYFNMEPHLKCNKIILVAEIIFLHFRHHVWNEVKLF